MAYETLTRKNISSELAHFTDLVRHGRFPGASSGEIRAAKLAEVALDEIGGLDEKAQDGFIQFVRIAAVAYTKARTLITTLSPGESNVNAT